MLGEFPAFNLSLNSWTKIIQRMRLNVLHHKDEVAHQKAQKTKINAPHCDGFLLKPCIGSVFLSIMPVHEKTRWAQHLQTFELAQSDRGTKATCKKG